QPGLTPQAPGAFAVDHQALGPAQRVRFAPAPPRMFAGDLPQPVGQHPISRPGAHRPTLHRPGLPGNPAGPPFRHPEPLPQHRHGPAAAVRAQKFPREISLSMSISRACSATIFFNRAFSRSSSFNRLASSDFMPPYWFCQRCQVASEISRCLEPLSGSVAESSPADEGCGEVEESVVDVGAAFPSDGQATELVEQGEGLFDDPASRGDLVAGSSSWDVAGDATLPQFLVDAGVVVALVRDQGLDAVARRAGASAQWLDAVEEFGQQ